jgi:hypothetical protein
MRNSIRLLKMVEFPEFPPLLGLYQEAVGDIGCSLDPLFRFHAPLMPKPDSSFRWTYYCRYRVFELSWQIKPTISMNGPFVTLHYPW